MFVLGRMVQAVHVWASCEMNVLQHLSVLLLLLSVLSPVVATMWALLFYTVERNYHKPEFVWAEPNFPVPPSLLFPKMYLQYYPYKDLLKTI